MCGLLFQLLIKETIKNLENADHYNSYFKGGESSIDFLDLKTDEQPSSGI